MATLKLYQDNDQLILINGLKNEDGDLITGADLTAVIVDRNGETVVDSEVSFEDVTDSPGDYQALLSYSFAPLPGTYTLRLTGLNLGTHLYLEAPVSVAKRTK